MGKSLHVMTAVAGRKVTPETHIGFPEIVSRALEIGVIEHPKQKMADKLSIHALVPAQERAMFSNNLVPCATNPVQRSLVVQVEQTHAPQVIGR